MSSTEPTSVADKRAQLEEERIKKNPQAVDRVKIFFKGFFQVLIYLFLVFFFSPPLFYACQFLNKEVLNKKFEYEGYDKFEDYFENEIEFPTGKNRGATLPLNQRPLVPNIIEAFNAGIAKGYFTSFEVLSGALEVIGQLLDFNHTLGPELFKKNTPNSRILNSLTKLVSDRKPNGPVGKLFGSVMILLCPLIYLLLLIGFPLVSAIDGMLTVLTTLNVRTYIKIIVIITAIIVLYVQSYFTLFIPTVFFLFIPQIAAGVLIFLAIAGLLFLALGIPSISIFFGALFSTAKALGAIFWLPEYANSYFRDRMNQSEKAKFENVKLQGTRYEYPGHAREFAPIYSMVFTFLTLGVALNAAFG